MRRRARASHLFCLNLLGRTGTCLVKRHSSLTAGGPAGRGFTSTQGIYCGSFAHLQNDLKGGEQLVLKLVEHLWVCRCAKSADNGWLFHCAGWAQIGCLFLQVAMSHHPSAGCTKAKAQHKRAAARCIDTAHDGRDGGLLPDALTQHVMRAAEDAAPDEGCDGLEEKVIEAGYHGVLAHLQQHARQHPQRHRGHWRNLCNSARACTPLVMCTAPPNVDQQQRRQHTPGSRKATGRPVPVTCTAAEHSLA